MADFDKVVQIEFYDETDPDEMIGYADFIIAIPRKGDIISMPRRNAPKPDGSFLYRYKVKEVDFWFPMDEDGVMNNNQQIAITLEEIPES